MDIIGSQVVSKASKEIGIIKDINSKAIFVCFQGDKSISISHEKFYDFIIVDDSLKETIDDYYKNIFSSKIAVKNKSIDYESLEPCSINYLSNKVNNIFSTQGEMVYLCTGVKYRSYFDGSYKFNDMYFAWFPHVFNYTKGMDDNTWTNQILEDGTILEKYVGDGTRDTEDRRVNQDAYRVTFVSTNKRGGPYKFIGIYKLDKIQNDRNRLYIKIADDINCELLK